MPTHGKETTEFRAARSSSTWGMIAMVLGVVVAIGSQVIGVLTELNPTWGTIAGGIIAVAGVIEKTLVDLGYINSRTEVKVNGVKPKE